MKEILLIICVLQGILAMPEQGSFEVNMTEAQNIAVFTKSMYNGTQIAVKIRCDQDEEVQIKVTWLLRWTPCAQEYSDIDSATGLAQWYLTTPEMIRSDLPYQYVKYQTNIEQAALCSQGKYVSLQNKAADGYNVRNGTRVPAVQGSKEQKSVEDEGAKDDKDASAKSREKRAADPTDAPSNKSPEVVPPNKSPEVVPSVKSPDVAAVQTTTMSPMSTTDWMMDPLEQFFLEPEISSDDFHEVTRTWEDGVYLFIIKIDVLTDHSKFNATVDVRMKGPHSGFLSAIEWPLLPFYAVMCVVYVIFGLIWLFLSACNWRDLLRIQFWIGGVIFLGMLEKAVFFSQHEAVNTTGHTVQSAMLFGELVSCMKRTLARMLVIVVSLGFGIVKPRLGPMLHKVLAMGGLYFILSAVEGCLRVLKPKSEQSNEVMLAAIPLAVLDAAICWWIFTGLVNTIRTLRLRRNLVKLGLYRHFTNTLIFAVVASVAFMVWSITQHKFSKCLSDWKELWVDEAFWHLLFSVILMVIMILWRPSANNQRYAFSPLMDAADDEAGEPMMNDAFDGMKMRSQQKGQNGSPIQKEKSKADEDLKWIDENIPTSVADTALPSLLDSDEEIMNTKYEMSKME